MSKRVCVLTSVHRSDDGRIFHRECVTLAHAGYEVTLVVPEEFKDELRTGVRIWGVEAASRRIGRPVVWLRLLRVAFKVRPAVVHFHDPELLVLGPFLKLLLGAKLTIIFDVHEYFIDSLADKFWIPVRIRPWSSRLAARLQRFLLKWVDGVICAVDGLTPLYKQSGLPTTVVRNLPLAELFEDQTPMDLLKGPGFKLIYVGLILPKRGINVVLEAMRLLSQSGHDDVFLYLIGGAVSQVYMDEIARFCRANDLTEKVSWLGAVPHEELKDYLAGANVGLLPGLMTAQYSNPGIATKLFEYMLCSLPVVSADYPHRRIFIDEAQCGLMVPPEDPAAHAAAIEYLVTHPEEAEEMGKRGRNYVLSSYTWEREQARLLDFYATVCFPFGDS
jgi:glycosyltransferase involved in cell wall biosynthesis